MKIQILGTGCPKCKKVAENAKKAVELSGAKAEIVKVDKIDDIMSFGIMMTPALAINDDVKVSGKVPSPDQIANWISEMA